MNDKIKILLEKINIDDNSYQYFLDAKMDKIKLNKNRDKWLIYISKDELLPIDVFKELESKKMQLDENAKSIDFVFEIKNPNLNTYLSYYPYLLETLKEDLKVLEIYEDCLKIEDDYLVLVTANEIEKEKLTTCLDKITNFYKKLDYQFNIDIIIRHEENVLKEIQEELNSIEIPKVEVEEKKEKNDKKTYRREPKDENSIIGRGIKEDPIKIKTIIGEYNNVVIEAKVFGIELFESSKTDFKIITLKVTDYSDSIYCKVFAREEEEYNNLCKEFKEGNWYKIRGQAKYDNFAKELVINPRDIMKIDKKESSVVDNSEVKRVELHCHTKMSQMDGVIDEEDVVKYAMKLGMNAVAITDHNGVQGFPHVFNLITSYNKKLEEGQKPFKAIYGAELVMIDDDVDIVLRPNDNIMLDETFVVFDFETTGFNAGGEDSIIESAPPALNPVVSKSNTTYVCSSITLSFGLITISTESSIITSSAP